MTGTLEEIGADIREIKEMGIDHLILCWFNIIPPFSPIYDDIDRTFEISKQLMHYAK